MNTSIVKATSSPQPLPDFIFRKPIPKNHSELPFPIDVMKIIFSYLNNLDLQKGLTISYLWGFHSLKFIKETQGDLLREFANFLGQQPRGIRFTLPIPTQEEFERTNLISSMQNLKDTVLKKLKSLTYDDIQQLAINSFCSGYLDGLGLLNALAGMYHEDLASKKLLSDKNLFLVVSNYDLASFLSKDDFLWLGRIARNSTESTMLTVAAHLQMATASLIENLSANDLAKLGTISNKLAKKANLNNPDSLKSQAMQALAMKLSALASRSPIPKPVVLKNCILRLPLFFKNIFLLAIIFKEIKDIKNNTYKLIEELNTAYQNGEDKPKEVPVVPLRRTNRSDNAIDNKLKKLRLAILKLHKEDIEDFNKEVAERYHYKNVLRSLLTSEFSDLSNIKQMKIDINKYLDKGYLTTREKIYIFKELKIQKEMTPPKIREFIKQTNKKTSRFKRKNKDKGIESIEKKGLSYIQSLFPDFAPELLAKAYVQYYLENSPHYSKHF